jgi:hypothetical protein
MSDKPRDPREDLKRILSALAESYETSGAEIADALRAQGRDPDKLADKLRARSLATAKEFLQIRLRKAREEYEGRASAFERGKSLLGATLAEWRTRLAAILSGNPEARALVTVQFRDYSTLSDTDFASLILQLKDLGVLDDLSPPPRESK